MKSGLAALWTPPPVSTMASPTPFPLPTRLGGKELIAQWCPFAASSVRMTSIPCMCRNFRTDCSCHLTPDSTRSQVPLPFVHALIPVPLTHPSTSLARFCHRARQCAEPLNYRREQEADPEPGVCGGRGEGGLGAAAWG